MPHREHALLNSHIPLSSCISSCHSLGNEEGNWLLSESYFVSGIITSLHSLFHLILPVVLSIWYSSPPPQISTHPSALRCWGWHCADRILLFSWLPGGLHWWGVPEGNCKAGRGRSNLPLSPCCLWILLLLFSVMPATLLHPSSDRSFLWEQLNPVCSSSSTCRTSFMAPSPQRYQPSQVALCSQEV